MPPYGFFDFIEEEQTLTAAALTVRIQALPYNDQGQLIWDQFFPRQDVPSVRIHQITTLDFRPVADRREWNTRGRLIEPRTPKMQNLEMVPIESYFKLGERTIQELTERTFGNIDLFRQIASLDIPRRSDLIAVANQRRIEVDFVQAWTTGTITARNPDTNAQHTVSYGMDAARYQVAATAWNDPTQNAYNNFLSWLYDAAIHIGNIVGVMCRRSTMEAIRAKAPNPLAFNPNVLPGVADMEAQIARELGFGSFRFFINERSVDLFNDASMQATRTKLWPTGVIAAVPDGVTIGDMAFAPVSRGYELSRQNPTAGIDVNGSVMYLETSNGGRELVGECQLNAFPVPNEQRIYVISVGV